ncbi:Ig-like domain-containing protein [Sphingomonas sp. MMS24-JH45]
MTLPSGISTSIGQPTNGRLVVICSGRRGRLRGGVARHRLRRHLAHARHDSAGDRGRLLQRHADQRGRETSRIDVVAVNDVPVAANDRLATAEDRPATIAVLANDSDADGDPLAVTAASALHGSVVRNTDGTLTYTPDRDFNGADTITYTVDDGHGGAAQATVAVTVAPQRDAPDAQLPVAQTVAEELAADLFRGERQCHYGEQRRRWRPRRDARRGAWPRHAVADRRSDVHDRRRHRRWCHDLHRQCRRDQRRAGGRALRRRSRLPRRGRPARPPRPACRSMARTDGTSAPRNRRSIR